MEKTNGGNISMKPKVLILKADGINRDEELAHAFNMSGGNSKIVHVNDLRNKKESLKNYNVLAIPGGFAYGDDIVSGKILAVELTSFFEEELKKFIARKDTATFGVCNGFQVLIRTGVLPFNTVGRMTATLTNNDSGHFECRWVPLKVEKNSRSLFLQGMEDETMYYPVAHGEGKFFTDDKTLQKIEKENLVAFRYVDDKGNPTQQYPNNPNGSLNAIVGVSDLTGRVLGLMPHPECFTRIEQHPNWRRGTVKKPQGLPLFQNIINFVKQA